MLNHVYTSFEIIERASARDFDMYYDTVGSGV
jgi:hypothetical protein